MTSGDIFLLEDLFDLVLTRFSLPLFFSQSVNARLIGWRKEEGIFYFRDDFDRFLNSSGIPLNVVSDRGAAKTSKQHQDHACQLGG